MVIVDTEVDEAGVQTVIDQLTEQVAQRSGEVKSVDLWGKRRFAYEIDHKSDGTYVVLQFVSDGSRLDDFERWLRLADEIVRHKLIRLPDHEAAKRGLLAAGTPATAG
jgi:small subunit ribosomal protein S6